jgi:hypothetical protein
LLSLLGRQNRGRRAGVRGPARREEQRVPGGLDPKDWELMLRVLDLIKQNVPIDVNAGPQEVFCVIEAALRAHYAKPIEKEMRVL